MAAIRCGIFAEFYYNHPLHQTGSYPLVKSSVHYTVADVNVHARVTQTYVSSGSVAQDVVYVFPLPSDAAVCAFTAVIDDERTITGFVKQKDEAKRDYDKAVSEGRTAGLLNQHTASVFQVSLGNLQPQQKIEVTIEFVSTVSHDGKLDTLRLTLPLSIAPNYGAPPDSLRTMPLFHRIRGSKRAFELTMEFNMSSNIQGITSATHPIALSLGTRSPDAATSFDPSNAHVALSTDQMLDKDIVVVLKAEGLDHPRCVVERRISNGSVSDALSLTLVPRFNLPPLPEQEYIFLIDRSGSMQGGRITAVRAALQIMLRSLPSSGTRFNLMSFGNRCDSLWPQSVDYSSESVTEASQHVDHMGANYGGTEIRGALQHAFNSRPMERRSSPTMVLLLTDGEAWDLEGVLKVTQEAVTESKGALRVFTLGVGDQVSTNMCDSIARAGCGVASYVGEQEKPDAKLMNLLKAARGAAVTDIKVDWGAPAEAADTSDDFELVGPDAPGMNQSAPVPNLFGAAYTPPSAFIAQAMSLFDPMANTTGDATQLGPRDVAVDLPPLLRVQESNLSKVAALYPGFRTSIFAIIQQSNNSIPLSSRVIVKGKVHGAPVQLEVAVTDARPVRQELASNFIHALAAREFIQELEDETVKSSSIKAKIVRLGTTYGLSSSQTSFVAIDQNGQVRQRPPPPPQTVVTAGAQFAGATFGSSFSPSQPTGFPNFVPPPPTGVSLFGQSTGYGGGAFGQPALQAQATGTLFGASPSRGSSAFGGTANSAPYFSFGAGPASIMPNSAAAFGGAMMGAMGASAPTSSAFSVSQPQYYQAPLQQQQALQQQQQQQQMSGAVFGAASLQPTGFGSASSPATFGSASPPTMFGSASPPTMFGSASSPAGFGASPTAGRGFSFGAQAARSPPTAAPAFGYAQPPQMSPQPQLQMSSGLFGKPVAPAPGPASISIETIARAQEFNGAFKATIFLTLQVGHLAKSFPSSLTGLASLSDEAREVVWATAVALAYLEKRFGSDQDSWTLLADKAREFVIGGIASGQGLDRNTVETLFKQWVVEAKKALP